MADTKAIRPADLLIDENNPRLLQPNAGQRAAYRALAELLKRKVVVLAADILEHGIDPSTLPIVMPSGDDTNRFIVLEGNRRLTALRALENPEIFTGAVDDVVIKELRDLSTQYQRSPLESVNCLVVKKREDADHWIQLRHTGENDGAGVVRWGSDEAARFKSRSGGMELHSQALNFLEEHGSLTQEQRRQIPAASFKRLLGTPEVRSKLGIDLQGGELKILGNVAKVVKALNYVTQRLSSGETKTKDIYTVEQRRAYAEAIPSSIAVAATTPNGTEPSSKKGKSKPKKPPKVKRQKARENLIPGDCVLVITDRRIREIESELRYLNIEDYPNATSVLFRVFIELSTDAYIDARGLNVNPKDKLRVKLQSTVNDLISRTKLTDKTAAPVRRALQKDSFLAPSLDLLHSYIHNENVFPGPSDLRSSWDGLQPFVVAIWSK